MSDVIELVFPVIGGGAVPIEHSHALYGSLKRAVPELATLRGLGIHTLRGLPDPPLLLLRTRAQLRLRIPAAAIPLAIGLCGKSVCILDREFEIGSAWVEALRPSPTLWARVVTQRFHENGHDKARAQLSRNFREAFGEGEVTLGSARTVRIHARQILGFEMLVKGLSPETSLRVQSEGFGGRRAFGCGLFVPTRAPRLGLA